MAKRAATKAAPEKAAVKTDVTMTATDNAPKATDKPEAAVTEGVTATDNVPADEEKKATEGMATMKAVTRYLDKLLNEIKDVGETYTVSKERAAELVRAKVAEIIK